MLSHSLHRILSSLISVGIVLILDASFSKYDDTSHCLNKVTQNLEATIRLCSSTEIYQLDPYTEIKSKN